MLWRWGLRTRWLFLRCRYVHDDSETSEDQVELLVSDGINAAEALLNIQVASRDINLSSIHLSVIYLSSIYLALICLSIYPSSIHSFISLISIHLSIIYLVSICFSIYLSIYCYL